MDETNLTSSSARRIAKPIFQQQKAWFHSGRYEFSRSKNMFPVISWFHRCSEHGYLSQDSESEAKKTKKLAPLQQGPMLGVEPFLLLDYLT